MSRNWFGTAVVLALLASSAPAAEVPQSLGDEAVAEIVKAAPKIPGKLDLGLKLKLIDFIDCTDPKDPHDFKDQGTSKVVTGPAGKYRRTAAHRHAFFAYRFKAAAKDQPMLIVWEYPDDAVRTINFSTHESGLSGWANAGWSLETIAYTGEPLPLSNKMQYHTFIMYPSDKWPCVLVGNFSRYGHPAAASRIWVYAIEGGLPKLEINAPQPDNQRRFGHFNSFAMLPTNYHFGLRSKNAVEHMLDYCQYIGVNELSWVVVANNSWGFWCDIPSWDRSAGDPRHLDRVLAAMDARGGFSFTAGFGPEGDFKMGGKGYREMSKEELTAALLKGFDEFLDRYGKYKSLRGIALGGMYGIQFYDRLRESGVLQDVVAHLKAKRPDLEVITYLGGRGLHIEYFDGKEIGGKKTPTTVSVISGWETSGQSWSDWLGTEALAAWKAWGRDPAEMKRVKGLTVWEQLQPDDHKIFDLYAQDPRAMIFYDLDNSQRRSDLVDSPYAAIWNTHSEGWYGLDPKVNFWYRKHWVAPDANAPSPLSLATFARTIGLHDRLAMVAGSWNNKYFGHEQHIRRFAKALRSLPPVVMKDVEGLPVDTVKVRWVVYKGKRYVSVVSLIPFASAIKIDGKTVDLPPYELVALVDNGTKPPLVAARQCMAYRKWVGQRIARFETLYTQVKALNARAAPLVYADTADQARNLLAGGRARAADLAVGAGLINELQLRKDILDPEKITAPRVSSAPPMNGQLDGWPKGAADLKAEGGRYIAGHLYFPNSWSGPDDMSARVRLCNDGQKLYVGIEVRDSVVARYDDNWNRDKRTFKRADSCQVRLSTNGAYRDWISPAPQKSDLTWPIAIPFDGPQTSGKGAAGFTYTCRRTAKGYLFEGSAPLAGLKVEPGGSIGFLLSVGDVDKEPNLKAAGWAAKQAFLFPHKPNFSYWDDVRNCAKLIIGK